MYRLFQLISVLACLMMTPATLKTVQERRTGSNVAKCRNPAVRIIPSFCNLHAILDKFKHSDFKKKVIILTFFFTFAKYLHRINSTLDFIFLIYRSHSCYQGSGRRHLQRALHRIHLHQSQRKIWYLG